MSEHDAVNLIGGPMDGQSILWPTRQLIRFGESVYMASQEPGEMVYLGEAQHKFIQDRKESTHAG